MKRKTVPQMNTVLMDKVISNADGTVSLRLVLDLRYMQEDRGQYEDALCYSRNIPFDMELVQASDPIALYVAAEQPHVRKENENGAVWRARQYYEKHREQAGRDALMLALLTHPDNDAALDHDPIPYSESKSGPKRKLPGIIDLPEPVRHLTDPVEARLRNFWQVLEENSEMLDLFYSGFNAAMGEMAVHAKELAQTDDKGFQPRAAN